MCILPSITAWVHILLSIIAHMNMPGIHFCSYTHVCIHYLCGLSRGVTVWPRVPSRVGPVDHPCDKPPLLTKAPLSLMTTHPILISLN